MILACKGRRGKWKDWAKFSGSNHRKMFPTNYLVVWVGRDLGRIIKEVMVLEEDALCISHWRWEEAQECVCVCVCAFLCELHTLWYMKQNWQIAYITALPVLRFHVVFSEPHCTRIHVFSISNTYVCMYISIWNGCVQSSCHAPFMHVFLAVEWCPISYHSRLIREHLRSRQSHPIPTHVLFSTLSWSQLLVC